MTTRWCRDIIHQTIRGFDSALASYVSARYALHNKNMIRTPATIANLEREVRLLRSFVIGIAGRDPEGDYRPQFVRKMLRAAHEEPSFRFTSAKDFLSHLHGRPGRKR